MLLDDGFMVLQNSIIMGETVMELLFCTKHECAIYTKWIQTVQNHDFPDHYLLKFSELTETIHSTRPKKTQRVDLVFG